MAEAQDELRALRQANDELRDRLAVLEARLETLRAKECAIESAQNAIAITDDKGYLAYVNPAFLKLWGYSSPDEVLGRRSPSSTGFWKSPAQADEVQHTVFGGGAWTGEMEAQAKDGQTFTVQVVASVVRGGVGQPVCMLASFVDITERVEAERRRARAEEALRESEARYRGLFNDASLAIFQSTLEGKTLAVNPAFARMFRFASPEEVVATVTNSASLFVDPGRRGEIIRLQAEHPDVTTFEHLYRRHDGSTFLGKLNVRRVVDLDNRPLLIEGFIEDITERKQAEEALRESELRFRTLVEQAPLAILISRHGTALYANQRLLEMFGLRTASAVIGRPVAEHFAPQFQEESRARTRRRALGLPVSTEFESMGLRQDGTQFPIQVMVAPVQLADGPANLAFVADITERVEAERHRVKAEEERERLQAQLLQAQKMEAVGQLAGGVAHDFNNMLTVILGHTELAMAALDPSHPLRADLEEISRAAQRSAGITRQLLAFARRQPIAPRVLDLNETVEGMLKMLRRLIGEDIDLVWLPQTGLWPIRMDPSQVDQILANLCVNARDAIGGVGKVAIETGNVTLDEGYCAGHPGSAPGDYVQLAVSDDGCGMGKETLARIFEPFFTTKPVGAGTGLGLATVYGIVKQNEGYISVYSERDDRSGNGTAVGTPERSHGVMTAAGVPAHGTTFRIYLPRPVGDTAENGAASVAVIARSRGETILLVEDELTILHLVKRMLESFGYRVLAAGTPEEALRLAEEQSVAVQRADEPHPEGEIDLLLTDVVMPGMSGPDLAQRVLALQPRIRRLYMSGYAADVIAHRGVLDEGVGFIQKPIFAHALAAKVREVLDATPGASIVL